MLKMQIELQVHHWKENDILVRKLQAAYKHFAFSFYLYENTAIEGHGSNYEQVRICAYAAKP